METTRKHDRNTIRIKGEGIWLKIKKTTRKTIPRGSTVQGKHGKYVSRKNLKKGDLVFFATTGKGRISHAGIYLGNKKFIHASSSKGKVVISSMASGHYYKTFVNGRRVI